MSAAQNRPMTHLTGLQALAVARAVAVEKMPYFSNGILDLVPREAPGLGTLAVTRSSILMVDFDAIRMWTPNQAAAVVLHEYMHIYLKHDERFAKLVAAGILTFSEEDQKLGNRCGDEEINDDLLEAGLELPSFTDKDGNVHGPITPASCGHPPNRLMEEYIKIEVAKRNKRSPQSSGAPGGGGVGGGSPDPNQMHGGAGCGHCGSGAGHPVPGEPEADDPDGRSEVDQEVSRKQTNEAIKQAQRSKGRVPAGLQRFVEMDEQPAKVRWQDKLSRSTRAAVAFRPGAIDYTRKRPSRRQGAFMGRDLQPVLPGMHAPIAEVAVVADTSGSMGEAEMKDVLNEANGVIKSMAGAKISFIACDAQVHAVVRTRRLAEIKLNMKGGGGTDFRPAFDAIAKLKPRPNVVIFATDGYGEYPPEPPKGIHVIWLVVNGGRIGVSWGEQIQVEPGEEDEDAA